MIFLTVLSIVGLSVLFLLLLSSGPRTFLGWMFFGEMWRDALCGLAGLIGGMISGLLGDN